MWVDEVTVVHYTKEQLNECLQETYQVAEYLGLSFDINKSTAIGWNFRSKSKPNLHSNIYINNTLIPPPPPNKDPMYLGTEITYKPQSRTLEKRMSDTNACKQINRVYTTGRNIITMIQSLCLSPILYTSTIPIITISKLNAYNAKITSLFKLKINSTNDIPPPILHLPIKSGGWNLPNIQVEYICQFMTKYTLSLNGAHPWLRDTTRHRLKHAMKHHFRGFHTSPSNYKSITPDEIKFLEVLKDLRITLWLPTENIHENWINNPRTLDPEGILETTWNTLSDHGITTIDQLFNIQRKMRTDMEIWQMTHGKLRTAKINQLREFLTDPHDTLKANHKTQINRVTARMRPPRTYTLQPISHPTNEVWVFTDGSYKDGTAAHAVVITDTQGNVIYTHGQQTPGEQTINNAELYAKLDALILTSNFPKVTHIIDSQYAMYSATTWGDHHDQTHSWNKVKNTYLIQATRALEQARITKGHQPTRDIWIKSHLTTSSIWIQLNNLADQLANYHRETDSHTNQYPEQVIDKNTIYLIHNGCIVTDLASIIKRKAIVGYWQQLKEKPTYTAFLNIPHAIKNATYRFMKNKNIPETAKRITWKLRTNGFKNDIKKKKFKLQDNDHCSKCCTDSTGDNRHILLHCQHPKMQHLYQQRANQLEKTIITFYHKQSSIQNITFPASGVPDIEPIWDLTSQAYASLVQERPTIYIGVTNTIFQFTAEAILQTIISNPNTLTNKLLDKLQKVISISCKEICYEYSNMLLESDTQTSRM